MSFFSWVLYIAIAIVALLVMIMIHEFGHYTAGKLLGFKINEFSVGFGKAILTKKKKNGEIFSLRAFPLGGYCAFEGEDEDKPQVKGAFNSMPGWKRLIVLSMGALFNFFSGVIFSFIFLMSCGYADRVQVTSVIPPQIEVENWVQEKDIIVAVGGEYTNFVYDKYFNEMIEKYDALEEFNLTVLRDGQEVEITVSKTLWENIKSKTNDTYGKTFSLDGENYNLAIVGAKVKNISTGKEYEIQDNFVKIEGKTYKIEEGTLQTAKIGLSSQWYKYGFFEALGEMFPFCFKWAWKILMILGQLVTGQIALTSMGGTITTVVTMAEATHTNLANLLLLLPLISVNLAVFNLLPFPALDGARMVFVLIEMIRKKPIDRNIEGNIHFIGLIILFAFVLLVDILHFIP